VVGVGLRREVGQRASRGPGSHRAFVAEGAGASNVIFGPPMPKQQQPNGAPGKKPPAWPAAARLLSWPGLASAVLAARRRG
jgi:hypothetical protein